MSQDRRRVDRQNPVRKAKKTGIGSGISADDVVGCRGEGEVPPVEESVWTCCSITHKTLTLKHTVLCNSCQKSILGRHICEENHQCACVDLFNVHLSEMILCVMPTYHQLKSKVQGACGDVVPHTTTAFWGLRSDLVSPLKQDES